MHRYKFDKMLNRHTIIGFLTVYLFVGSYALEYSLLENLEMSCLPRDHCQLAHRAKFADRSCECDSECNNYRDCCIDKARLTPLIPTRTRKYTCMTFGSLNKDAVYVVDTCPQSYTSSADIRNLCHEGNNSIDPVVSAPVTVLSTGTTYKNRYCAECNGATASALVTWLVDLNCETLIPFQVNDSYIWQNVKYNPRVKTWGVDLGDVFHKCDIIYDKPSHLTAVRFCRANTIDSCPPSFPRPSIKRLCESYSAVVYDVDNAYKNPHCAICNEKIASSLTCLNSPSFMRLANKPFSFALLLDTNIRDGQNLTVLQTCPTGQMYDPFFKKCRRLVCSLPGYKIVNGKCRKP